MIKMAFVIHRKITHLSIKCAKHLAPHVYMPRKYQRLLLHTSRILDVEGKELRMPSLSPTMESGTIVKWLKKEGDVLQPGDAVADIQTDKAVVTMETDDESVLAKIIVAEGTKDVKVGTLIALTVEQEEDWKSVEMPSGASVASSKAKEDVSASVAAPSAVTEQPPIPGQQNVAMPALSPTMTTGTIVKWLKKEGDEIEPGDALAEIQTDKAVMTFEMEEECVLAKILVAEGNQATVGQLVAVTVEKGTDWKSVVAPSATSAQPSTPSVETSGAGKSIQAGQSRQVYGLAVKRLLEEYKINPASIKGTGRTNRLLKSDVLAYIQTNKLERVTFTPESSTSPKRPVASEIKTSGGKSSSYVEIPVSNIRAVIAKRLGESKSTVPHSYAYTDIRINKLTDLRSELKADNINVSINDFITKAVAHALVECPEVNALCQNGYVKQMPNVDISIAVASPTGLITPIVFNATSKSLTEISQTIRQLAEKARKGALQPQEFQGGTFTISNLGMYGIKQFSAIINAPQAAILAVGGGRDELDTSLSSRSIMSTTLSYDKRAIDEDQALDFLAVLKAILEDPAFLAVGKIQALRHQQE